MKRCVFIVWLVFVSAQAALCASSRISADTKACIECHTSVHPGIVADWEKGRMAKVTPKAARSMILKKRMVSFEKVPDKLARVFIGCAECHTTNPEKHADTFDHYGYQVHVVVTPEDCATWHPLEVDQYGKNIMTHANGNPHKNPVNRALADSVNGIQSFRGMKTTYKRPDDETDADSCFYCHGTLIEVKGMIVKDTAEGEMAFPVLSGWPNQGVWRINPDGSKGLCTACHTRHQFSIEMARKPDTCAECHKGPDVPAYQVYTVSKHGNIYSSLGKSWNYKAVPWTLGKDFTAPTCATCHVKNKAGLPLPTELTGEPVAKYLIDATEQKNRRKVMQKVCLACHSRGWVDGHFARFENTVKTTNEMTLAATKILLSAWEKGAARGLAQKDSIFNEAIEKKWVEQWLFFANSTRFSSAMAGADYGAFANGRWYMSKNTQEMINWLELKLKERK